MPHINIFKLLLTISFLKMANAINACPVADTVYTGTGGIRYRICPDTDLTGGSNSVTANVASVTTCAQLCDQSMNCFKAVYDTQTKDCHFKALTGLNWVVNARFDVVQVEQVNIARCPYAETTYTNNGVRISSLKLKKARYSNATVLENL
jgi:galactose oxidase